MLKSRYRIHPGVSNLGACSLMGHLSPFVQSCSEAGFPPLCRGEAPSHKRRITLALSSRGWSEGWGAGLGHLHRQGLSTCSEQKRVKILQAKFPGPGMCRAPVLRKEKSTGRKRIGQRGGFLLILNCRGV